MLLTYFLFLISGAIVIAAFGESPILSGHSRSYYIGTLLGPPLLLVSWRSRP